MRLEKDSEAFGAVSDVTSSVLRKGEVEEVNLEAWDSGCEVLRKL